MKTVWIDKGSCSECGTDDLCLHTDGSEEEFEPVLLCSRCLTEAVQQMEEVKKEPQTDDV